MDGPRPHFPQAPQHRHAQGGSDGDPAASQQSAGHSGNTLQIQGLINPSSSHSPATSQLQISSFKSAMLGAVTPQKSTNTADGFFLSIASQLLTFASTPLNFVSCKSLTSVMWG